MLQCIICLRSQHEMPFATHFTSVMQHFPVKLYIKKIKSRMGIDWILKSGRYMVTLKRVICGVR